LFFKALSSKQEALGDNERRKITTLETKRFQFDSISIFDPVVVKESKDEIFIHRSQLFAPSDKEEERC